MDDYESKYLSQMRPYFESFLFNNLTENELRREHQNCVNKLENILKLLNRYNPKSYHYGVDQYQETQEYLLLKYTLDHFIATCSKFNSAYYDYLTQINEFLNRSENYILYEVFESKHKEIMDKSIDNFKHSISRAQFGKLNFIEILTKKLLDLNKDNHKRIERSNRYLAEYYRSDGQESDQTKALEQQLKSTQSEVKKLLDIIKMFDIKQSKNEQNFKTFERKVFNKNPFIILSDYFVFPPKTKFREQQEVIDGLINEVSDLQSFGFKSKLKINPWIEEMEELKQKLIQNESKQKLMSEEFKLKEKTFETQLESKISETNELNKLNIELRKDIKFLVFKLIAKAKHKSGKYNKIQDFKNDSQLLGNYCDKQLMDKEIERLNDIIKDLENKNEVLVENTEQNMIELNDKIEEQQQSIEDMNTMFGAKLKLTKDLLNQVMSERNEFESKNIVLNKDLDDLRAKCGLFQTKTDNLMLKINNLCEIKEN